MEDEELKRRLAKIPDADENGDPIYKIDDVEKPGGKFIDESDALDKNDSSADYQNRIE